MHSIETLFLLIKQAICKYIFTPLTCSKEDINKLSNEIFILITNKILDYNIWYNRFKFYLKIQSSGELNNLVGYVKNHI
jgi:hypothetical protein